jgi:Flp pilus assembly pilin Flp
MNQLVWGVIRAWIARFCRDERGQTITEYAIIMGTLTLVCIFLIDPNNGLYGAIRNVYDRMMFMLVWPGP